MEGGVPALLYAPNFGELRLDELRRNPIPRTSVPSVSKTVVCET